MAIPYKTEMGEETSFLIRLVRGPKDSEKKPIVFATSLLDEEIHSTQSIRELYRSRWAIETMYNRMKNLLQIEKFHARSWNPRLPARDLCELTRHLAGQSFRHGGKLKTASGSTKSRARF